MAPPSDIKSGVVTVTERAGPGVSANAPGFETHRHHLVEYALRLGDDALIIGQRLAEWCGHAPELEIDLSLANLGLDLIGQATFLLGLAGDLQAQGRDADSLAFHRDALAFRNCLMVEQPNGDFGQTIARQFLFSTYQLCLYQELQKSAHPRLAEIAAKAVKEVRYHADLSAEWVIRLGDGTEESRRRMLDGLDWHWRFVDELFVMDEIEQALASAGIAANKITLRADFDVRLACVMGEAILPLPVWPRAVIGGRNGHHSEHLGHILAVMQYLPRSYPEARW